jgi:hypothetical protein
MEENSKNNETAQLGIGAVMPRFFVDKRVGCIAIRDSHHPDFDIEHQGLDSELLCVVKFEMGKKVNNEWIVSDETIEQFNSECASLNEA